MTLPSWMQPKEPDDPLERKVGFGQYRDATWGQVIDRDPDWVQWALDNVDWIGEDVELHDALSETLVERQSWNDFDRPDLYDLYGDD